MQLSNTEEKNKADKKTFDDNIIKRSLILKDMYDFDKIKKGLSEIIEEDETVAETKYGIHQKNDKNKDPKHQKYMNQVRIIL